jgi:hypothetical protein
MLRIAFTSFVLVSSALAATARAAPDDVVPSGAEMDREEIMVESPRSMANDWIIPERGWTLGAALAYETSGGGDTAAIAKHGLAFTDVALLRLAMRAVVHHRVEVYGGLDLLPKQPSYTNELVFQGAHLGALVALPHHLAFDVRADESALLEHTGQAGGARAGLTGRRIVHEILAYEGEVAASYTVLRFDEAPRAWLAEVSASGSIVFRAPEGAAAAWVGFAFAFPVAHGGALPGVGPMDPQVRSDVRIGAVVSLVKLWDVYAEYAVLDRGDYSAPRTMLPILDGGFDQQQLTIGIVRHFGQDRAPEVPDEINVASADRQRRAQ